MRYDKRKVNFAGIQGNTALGKREVTNWPLIVNLHEDPYEMMPFESEMYLRWYAADRTIAFVVPGASIVHRRNLRTTPTAWSEFPSEKLRVGKLTIDGLTEGTSAPGQ